MSVLMPFCSTVALAQMRPEAGAAAECGRCNFGRTVIEDTRQVFTAPARWEKPEWRVASYKALAVVGTMAALDEPVRNYAQRHRSGSTDGVAKTFEPFGAEYAAGVLLGYALVGKIADKPKARNTALDGTVATLITSGLIVPVLKGVTGRSRPRTEQGAFDFHLLGGDASFPSGHTAAAFALATSVAENNDHRWIKGLSYGVAALVGYSRIEHDAHWLSDTTASAFIGIAVAKSVTKLDRKRHSLAVTPLSAPNAWGFQVSTAF